MVASIDRITQILKSIPNQYRGPGGAIAVVQNGHCTAQHVWGYANLDERIPMTAQTKLPICSITKQMVCMVLRSMLNNPVPSPDDALDPIWQSLEAELQARLHEICKTEHGRELSLAHLCNNVSGIRDYWAMSTLWGAKADDVFGLEHDAPNAVERTRSLHFKPGSEYSYCNLNFHIIGRLIEQAAEKPLGRLLEDRIFKPAGMKTARLIPDTALLPEPCVGYEADEAHGFFPARNRMQWSGDAGIVAALEDMIAYEKWAQSAWDDPQGLYRGIASSEQTYNDGSPAGYAYGLGRSDVGGIPSFGHGGMLRGFRLHRLHIPSERLSVVVMFNHEADAGSAATRIAKRILDIEEEPITPDQIGQEDIPSDWIEWQGSYLDINTQLKIDVQLGKTKGDILITYAGYPETLKEQPNSAQPQASSTSMKASITSGMLMINRITDHRTLLAKRIVTRQPEEGPPSPVLTEFTGEYYCADADSTFRCTGDESMLFGSFDGYLGKGPGFLIRYLGEDVCSLSNPRGLDAPAPGDWTLVFRRDRSGKVSKVTIGCWLARNMEFVRRK